MINKEIIIRRLSLIKYLYSIGIEQSRQSEPYASFSILMMHDSVEMFLKLAAEHQDIKSEKFSFLDYWTSIPSLTLLESMRNLNSRRVNIKHKGLMPSKGDVEISRVNTIDFFEQNTFPQFAIDFKEISLFSLIQDDKVRRRLEDSQNYLYEKDMKKCIETVAIAFDILLSSYERSKSRYYRLSPFNFRTNFNLLNSSYMGINYGWDKKVGRPLGEFIDKVGASLNELQSAVKIMSFGIDYKRFVKFQLLTPQPIKMADGEYFFNDYGKKKLTDENCQFCIDFVLDCSLKLQEFDFHINDLHET